MTSPSTRKRTGLSLTETVVVVAMVAVLAALLLPAISRLRQTGYDVQCLNNLRQLGEATQNFAEHDQSQRLPPYFGTYGFQTPPPLGSWFLFLMPYVEQKSAYDSVEDDIKSAGSNTYSWAAPASQPTNQPAWLAMAMGIEPFLAWNGHVAKPGGNPPPTLWPMPPPGKTGHGIWFLQTRTPAFKILQCPSDPSVRVPPMDLDNQWSTTSYVPNWHAWTDGKDQGQLPGPPSQSQNAWVRPQRSLNEIGSLSRTVLLAEAYANCDQMSRAALANPEYWGFGIDWYGNKNTNMFQVHPQLANSKRLITAENPASNYCNNWTTQTGHSAMHVLLADASSHIVKPNIGPSLWASLINPFDNPSAGDDWLER